MSTKPKNNLPDCPEGKTDCNFDFEYCRPWDIAAHNLVTRGARCQECKRIWTTRQDDEDFKAGKPVDGDWTPMFGDHVVQLDLPHDALPTFVHTKLTK